MVLKCAVVEICFDGTCPVSIWKWCPRSSTYRTEGTRGPLCSYEVLLVRVRGQVIEIAMIGAEMFCGRNMFRWNVPCFYMEMVPPIEYLPHRRYKRSLVSYEVLLVRVRGQVIEIAMIGAEMFCGRNMFRWNVPCFYMEMVPPIDYLPHRRYKRSLVSFGVVLSRVRGRVIEIAMIGAEMYCGRNTVRWNVLCFYMVMVLRSSTYRTEGRSIEHLPHRRNKRSFVSFGVVLARVRGRVIEIAMIGAELYCD